MSLITESLLVDRLKNELIKSRNFSSNVEERAKEIINESKSFIRAEFDIFLSHSSQDAKLVAGLKLVMEDMGYKVYVDWIEDPQMSRENIDKSTAQTLQQRMKESKSLVYAFSHNSLNSKWMPWELGYFDGINGLVSVMPISKNKMLSFKGTEYLSIYPYVDIATIKNSKTEVLWINESINKYVKFEDWLNNKEQPYIHNS